MRILLCVLLIILLLPAAIAGADPAWHIGNLYDEETDSYFIPYQLWTGAAWDGSKKLEFHNVDSAFMHQKSIQGPELWMHPYLKKEFKVYRRINGGKIQLFSFFEKGIGRVYDSREARYFDNDIKFPAGYGWKIGMAIDFEQKFWSNETPHYRTVTIEILEISFDKNKTLKQLRYRYSVNHKPDHEYTYRPNKGMTSLIELADHFSGHERR